MFKAVLKFFGLGKSDVRASMDLTKTTNENKRHWRDADALSPRAAYPLSERKIARERSRLEAENNSWYSGMLRTAANHIVGVGPSLQVLTDNADLNSAIEAAWKKWTKSVGFTAKLKIAVQTYWRDGAILGMRASRSVRPYGSPISLDVRLYESDQMTNPQMMGLEPSVDDGKRVDNLGNAVEYYINDYHPGDLNIGTANITAGQWYPASDVWHLYRADRPGQLHGIPRCAPAIDYLAHMRRFDKATLGAAEAAALWGVFMTTTSNQVAPANTPGDFASFDWDRPAINFVPEGWEPKQLRADHPATTNEMFQRASLMYFARCANMPYSLACGTSKDANFSAAKMDIKNLWQPEVESEQEALNTIVMCPVFRWFLDDLAIETDILDAWEGTLEDIAYQFVWPPLPQSDEMDVANASEKRMQSGQSTPAYEAMLRGSDYETQCIIAAQNYGVSVEEYKKALFYKHFSTTGVPGGMTPPVIEAPQKTESKTQPEGQKQRAESPQKAVPA